MEIRRWLHDDRSTPYSERLERDRAIGRALDQHRAVDRVLAWWDDVRASESAALGDAHGLGERVVVGRRLASAGLALFGLLLGAAVVGVALGYDGRYPVNLFTLLGVLVGLPLLMLLFTLLLLPGRVPGLRALQSVIAGMNPGRWAGAWLDRFLGADLFAPGLLRSGGTGAFSKWQLLVFSQWLALGFFAGALSVALLRVTFTDLAFGWSTTLNVDAALVHRALATLAAPWAGWLPDAAPDAALVEASRFFRLEEGGMPQARAAQLGAWWPFVLMTMVVYGALPRLLLLLFGGWRLRRATVALLLDDPEVSALLDRMDAPLLALGGSSEEERLEAEREGLPAPRELPSTQGLVLLVWNAAADRGTARRWLADHLGASAEASADVGILQREDAQRGTLADVRQALDGPVRRVVLVTKGWEPPLLEFMDFLGLVREAFGGEATITVVPLNVSASAVEADDRDVWARALARVRDPRLYVLDAVAEAS
ncbi:MAG: DUF2868 domain-containing protein [Pseudomonadales bacterium]